MSYVAYEELLPTKLTWFSESSISAKNYPADIDCSDSKLKRKVATACMLITLGTGGVVNASNVTISNNGLISAVDIDKAVEFPLKTTVPSISDRILELKNTLNLTMSDIAKILNLQRPTIYQWIRGTANPRDANVLKVNKLYELALSLKDRQQILARTQLTAPLEGGGTILEQLQVDDIDLALLKKNMQDLLPASETSVKEKVSLASSLKEKGFSKLNTEKLNGNVHGRSIGSRID